MKIDNSIKGVPAQATAPAAARTGVQPAPTPAGQGPDPMGAQVELSRTSTRILQDGQDYSAARVAEIRKAIAEGRFEINPERIADGLLDSVREFLGDRRQPGA